MWAATTFDSWIVATPASGSGPGSLGVGVAANDGVSRFGYFSVEGRRVLVRQSGAGTNAPPTFERQGLGPAGQTFPLGADPRGISGDGRYVAFTATVARLPSGATVQRVFLRDRVAGITFDVSGAPGGPPDDPAISHVVLGVSDADLAAVLGGTGLTTDGRFLYFAPIPEPGTPPGACYLFDVTTASSFALPAGIGGSGYQCPSMSLNGRFFAARDDTGKLVRLHDRATQQTVSVVLPGLASQDIVLSVYASRTGRYIVATVAQVDLSCSPIFCFRYAMILDRSTGQTARGPAHPGQSVHLVAEGAAATVGAAVDGVRTAAIPLAIHGVAHRVRADRSADRSGGAAAAAARAGEQFSFDCGWAVNGGKQIVFQSLLHLAPGDVYAGTPDMHVYTRSSGLVTRVSTGIDGNTFPIRVSTISQNGRYLLGLTTSAWTINADSGVTDVVVLDLGVLASSSGGGRAPPPTCSRRSLARSSSSPGTRPHKASPRPTRSKPAAAPVRATWRSSKPATR